MNWLQNIFEPLAQIFTAKIDLKKTKIEAEATAYQTAAKSAADWEAMAAQNAANSWLDEIWTAVLLVPLVLAFAGYGDTVDRGFDALQDMPEFYTWSVMCSVGWAFARKDVPKLINWARRQKQP